MSVQRVKEAIERIRAATPESRIAVYDRGDDFVETVFADTVGTQARLKHHDPRLIGVFHWHPDATPREFRQIIEAAKARRAGAPA